MKNSIIKPKSDKFAVRIINLHNYLSENKKASVLFGQILRSGTSIGANISEAYCAGTDKDFINKFQIAFKECSETLFWLKSLHESGYLTEKQYESINKDCDELIRLIASSIKTSRAKQANRKIS